MYVEMVNPMDVAVSLYSLDDYRGNSIDDYLHTCKHTRYRNLQEQFANALKALISNGIETITHLYLGSERCHLSLPTEREIVIMLDLCSRQNLTPVLVLPQMFDTDIDKIAKILVLFGEYSDEMQVVVNDYGTALLIKELGVNCKPISGRMMDNRTKELRCSPEHLRSHYKILRPEVVESLYRGFTEKSPKDWAAVEIDAYPNWDIFKKQTMSPKIGAIPPIHAHLATTVVTTGRFCLMRMSQSGKQNPSCIYSNCNKACLQSCNICIKQTNQLDRYDLVLIERGNTIYAINQAFDPIDSNVSRIIIDCLP